MVYIHPFLRTKDFIELAQTVVCAAPSVKNILFFYLSQRIGQVVTFPQTFPSSKSLFMSLSRIAIISFTSYKIYSMPSFLIRGYIYGVHTTAMMLFSHSLTNSFRIREDLLIDSSRAEKAASITFMVSSISLTLIFQNPILANTVAYSLASLVKMTAMRYFPQQVNF
jgi:hypothetical protein